MKVVENGRGKKKKKKNKRKDISQNEVTSCCYHIASKYMDHKKKNKKHLYRILNKIKLANFYHVRLKNLYICVFIYTY